MWLVFVIISALSLGLYDIFQKISLRGNAIIPVLYLSIVVSAVIFTPLVLLSHFSPQTLQNTSFFVPQVDARTHFFIFLKAIIVLVSWILTYAGMKHLPLTIVSPIKSTQPVWTVVGAMLIFSETLNGYQTTGVIITLLSFYLFSIVGKKEGVSFRSNKWVWFLILGTLAGACSGLYDKYLMREFDRVAVQVYNTYYQVILMGIVLVAGWYPTRKKTTPFTWRWSILAISAFLIISDFFYFYALSNTDSLIAVVSPLRRTGLLVPFIYGAFFFKEKNLWWKLLCLAGLLIGVYFLFLGSW
jgi:drug/metabolite transporter (DMT)-like permease